MDFEQLLQFNLDRWHRNILNSYWLVLCFTVLAKAAMLKWGYQETADFLTNVVIPAVVLVLIVVSSEIAMHLLPQKRHSYLLLGAAEAIALVLSLMNSQAPIVMMTFLLPILISLFYFELKKLYITAAASLGLVLLLLVFDVPLRHALNPITLITTFGALGAGVYLAVHIMGRSVETMKHLKATIEANEQLLIQSVMMESASKLDGLTNTYNHKSFHEHMDSLLQQPPERQVGDFQIHLFIIDIDDFKKVNDTFGHQSGDIILKRVADTIRHHCLPNDFLARYGGEEFALTMVGRSTMEAVECGKAICTAVGTLYHPEIRGRAVTISMGLAEHQADETKDELFKAADTALYTAKRQGKNRLVFASPQYAQASDA